jgi:hypothetical protein
MGSSLRVVLTLASGYDGYGDELRLHAGDDFDGTTVGLFGSLNRNRGQQLSFFKQSAGDKQMRSFSTF